MNLEDKLDNLPAESGVYLFSDEYARIIYIGKAANLRSRVRSYFSESGHGEGARRMMLRKRIADIDYVVVNTPVEALILEANLIKRHRPAFNVTMKDDKGYPSIEITMGDQFPRMRIIRSPSNKESRYFGPYTNSGMMRRTFKLIQKAFKIRTCKYDLKKNLDRPCLDFHINLCPGPCVGYIESGDYRKMCERACNFLDGRTDALLRMLKRDLREKTELLEFEKCITLRDQIKSIEFVTQRHPVVTGVGEDMDFIAIEAEQNYGAVAVLQVRDGKLLGRQKFLVSIPVDSSGKEIMERFIQRYYQPGFFIPPLLCLSVLPDDAHILEAWMSGLRGRKVELKVPVRGEKKEILELADKNALEHLAGEKRFSDKRMERNRDSLQHLKDILKLNEMPSRIEGYDISNISGEMAAASMVVFKEGEAFKPHYRKFRIKLDEGPDDFAMMGEALTRRLENLKIGELESFRETPDLILIDGGKGQLNAALKASRRSGFQNLKIISIAKQEEEIFVPFSQEPLPVDPDSPGVLLLRRVRDEAHRFAVSYHRKLREKGLEVSILESIPGISKKRKEILLKNFDSIEDIAGSTLYDLQELPGFNRKLAENILKFLGSVCKLY